MAASIAPPLPPPPGLPPRGQPDTRTPQQIQQRVAYLRNQIFRAQDLDIFNEIQDYLLEYDLPALSLYLWLKQVGASRGYRALLTRLPSSKLHKNPNLLTRLDRHFPHVGVRLRLSQASAGLHRAPQYHPVWQATLRGMPFSKAASEKFLEAIFYDGFHNPPFRNASDDFISLLTLRMVGLDILVDVDPSARLNNPFAIVTLPEYVHAASAQDILSHVYPGVIVSELKYGLVPSSTVGTLARTADYAAAYIREEIAAIIVAGVGLIRQEVTEYYKHGSMLDIFGLALMSPHQLRDRLLCLAEQSGPLCQLQAIASATTHSASLADLRQIVKGLKQMVQDGSYLRILCKRWVLQEVHQQGVAISHSPNTLEFLQTNQMTLATYFSYAAAPNVSHYIEHDRNTAFVAAYHQTYVQALEPGTLQLWAVWMRLVKEHSELFTPYNTIPKPPNLANDLRAKLMAVAPSLSLDDYAKLYQHFAVAQSISDEMSRHGAFTFSEGVILQDHYVVFRMDVNAPVPCWMKGGVSALHGRKTSFRRIGVDDDFPSSHQYVDESGCLALYPKRNSVGVEVEAPGFPM
ncbi:Hypothetical predicted protein [Lecanosticta acicola]|uniref:Uncharacterized protein n=1 Tax=Lecanosticta acicola TaxID=111012 RepID=A0AAI9ED83_9PEZI|nr:Hypothetical predicted protein [Lecanosticta acicola]